MNNRLNQERSICKFNLRGMCRFGTRCWNIHEQPVKKENVIMVKPSQIQEDNVQGACLGACALPANNAKETDSSFNKDIYGPSTSSVEEAIALVKISESEERTCGICFDNILQKTNKEEQTFGILPNCNHCFCFTCIRKWRQSKEFEFEVSKACPECRIASDFVYPSKMWMTTKIEKDTFIDNQRKKMKQKDCMYFRKGKGKCPFGNTCLYLHALPNGKVLDVGPPKPRRRAQGTSAIETEAEMLQQILFWINDDEVEVESDGEIDDFDIDLDDPYIAMQYYDSDDIRRYMAMDRIMNGSDDDDDDDLDIEMIF